MTEALGVLLGDGVRFVREYPTTAADLWSALTDPERLERGFATVTGDLRPGGRVTIRFDDGAETMEVVSCEPPTTLVVRWLHGDHTSEVTATVEPRDGAALLVLEHRGLPPAKAPDYAAGWHVHLDSLAALLRGEEPGGGWAAFEEMLARYR